MRTTRIKLSKKEKDFALVQKALCGDQIAFQTIYDGYHNYVRQQVFDIVQDYEVACDITMEVFEKAFERLVKFQPDYQLSSWLIKIGRNFAIDYCRKKNRVNIVSIDINYDESEEERPTVQVIDPDLTPDENVAKRQRIEVVRKMLKMLPDSHRKAIEMKYLNSFGYEEIADELDLTTQQVKNIIHKARKDLIQLFELLAVNDVKFSNKSRFV